jgi:hypothetical protein
MLVSYASGIVGQLVDTEADTRERLLEALREIDQYLDAWDRINNASYLREWGGSLKPTLPGRPSKKL